MNEKLMTVGEVAKFLGYKPKGVYLLVAEKRIPVVKISRRALRFRPSEIEAWLNAKAQAAVVQDPRQPSQPKNGVKADYVDKLIDKLIDELVENAKKEAGEK